MSIRGILNRKIGIGNCTDISFVADREGKGKQTQVGAEKELEKETEAGLGAGVVLSESAINLSLDCVRCMQHAEAARQSDCCLLCVDNALAIFVYYCYKDARGI